MCGIIGYTGRHEAAPILLDGLLSLEYRGYDSAGVAFGGDGEIKVCKTKGRVDDLRQILKAVKTDSFSCGIGHTRWATHGEPSDTNAHPHATERLALVHNGIIENYTELEHRLSLLGYSFESETDTEAAAKLLDHYFDLTGDPIRSLFDAVKDIRGSFAFAVIFRSEPNTLYAIRKDSPLIVASTESGAFAASDIPAILKHTNKYCRLPENTVARLSPGSIELFGKSGLIPTPPEESIDWNVDEAQKSGYPHFMIKEIFEEPDAIRKTVLTHLIDGLPAISLPKNIGHIHIVACGTAMHAGLIGKTLIERLARVPVNVEIASEFRYRDPILAKDDLVILLSQSGETADTLAALRHARASAIQTLAIVNVIGSSIAREADDVIYTLAGPEIAVASTKAYSVQCALMALLAIRLSLDHGRLDDDKARRLITYLSADIPLSISTVLDKSYEIRQAAKEFVRGEHLFFIGRGIDSDLCTEGSLKLKEISYMHSEAYAAGELKHGTISLITEGVPVVALLTERSLVEKTISGIREVRSRGARVLSIATESIAKEFELPSDKVITIPDTEDLFEFFPAATVLQLFAYHASALRGIDVDKPRNLAKSVTVE